MRDRSIRGSRLARSNWVSPGPGSLSVPQNHEEEQQHEGEKDDDDKETKTKAKKNIDSIEIAGVRSSRLEIIVLLGFLYYILYILN
jgi:hypothetical protein